MPDERRKPQRPPTLGDRNDDRRWVAPATPESVDDDLTGRFDDPSERAEARAQRPTDQRLARLEKKQDKHDEVIADIRVKHGEIKGSLETLVTLASKAEAEREARHLREANEREAKRKYIVPVITAVFLGLTGIVAALVHAGCQ